MRVGDYQQRKQTPAFESESAEAIYNFLISRKNKIINNERCHRKSQVGEHSWVLHMVLTFPDPVFMVPQALEGTL